MLLAISGIGRAEGVVSEEGRFRIELPARAVEKEQTTPAGKLHLMVAKADDTEWTVSWIDLPGAAKEPEKIDARLDAIRDRLQDRLAAKLTADRKVMLADKHPGREVVLELPAGRGRLRTRYGLIGDRLYQVSVQGLAETVESSATTKTFDSFAIKK
jgi:hypothetical protein